MEGWRHLVEASEGTCGVSGAERFGRLLVLGVFAFVTFVVFGFFATGAVSFTSSFSTTITPPEGGGIGIRGSSSSPTSVGT